MTTTLQNFDYKGDGVRVVLRNGEPWFVLRDVCSVLGLRNPTVVASTLDDDERTKFNLGRQGKANLVNEPGLYGVIMQSRKPEASASSQSTRNGSTRNRR